MSSPEVREEVREPETIRGRIMAAFDRDELSRICTLPERRFAKAYGLRRYKVEQPQPYRSGTGVLVAPAAPPSYRYTCPDDFFAYRDNGSNILAVAHLDTVVMPIDRMCDFAETADGTVVHSGALDDRLGAYVILDMLPKLGINVDVLLTTGEESGKSTAKFFQPPKGKDYHWMIEFDRGGTDVVMYQYDSRDMDEIVRYSGAKTGNGAFSDICYLEHLLIKGFNWGVGYQDYHGVRGYAYLEDLFQMLTYFVRFHDMWADTKLDHDPKDKKSGRGWWRGGGGGHHHGRHDHRRGGPGGLWGAQSGSGGWWDDPPPTVKDKKDKDDGEDKKRMSSAASVLDDIEGPGPMVLAGDTQGEIEVISLDEVLEAVGSDGLDKLVDDPRLAGSPKWGDSLATSDPTDPEFVSPA
jgi:hypothetical protein